MPHPLHRHRSRVSDSASASAQPSVSASASASASARASPSPTPSASASSASNTPPDDDDVAPAPIDGGAEIACNSGVGLRIQSAALPVLPGAHAYAGNGIIPGGLRRNQAYLEQDGYVRYAEHIDHARKLLLFDPQTSGGLLVVLPPAAAAALQQHYADAAQPWWQIGKVTGRSGIEIV